MGEGRTSDETARYFREHFKWAPMTWRRGDGVMMRGDEPEAAGEARTKLIEAMARDEYERENDGLIGTKVDGMIVPAWGDPFYAETWEARRQKMEPRLDAVLACHTDQPCPECGELGLSQDDTDREIERDYGLRGVSQVCPTCGGSGTVPGPPAVLELVAEQVGSLVTNNYGSVYFAWPHQAEQMPAEFAQEAVYAVRGLGGQSQ